MSLCRLGKCAPSGHTHKADTHKPTQMCTAVLNASSTPKATLQTKLESGAVLAAFVALCVVNYLVTSGTGVKFSNTDIANTHPVYVLPIGYAFSIWGIIYLLEGLFSIYQALPVEWGGLYDARLEPIRRYVLGVYASNVAWLFLFGYEAYWVAAIVIVVYDYLLFQVVFKLDVNYLSRSVPLKTKLLVSAGFSANTSWVTVASLLQVQVNLLEEGWLASPALTAGELAIAVAVACAAVYYYSDIAYALVAAWALFGIIQNQAESSTWGCASQICKACAPGMDICERADSSPFSGRPNGFAGLCDGWNSTQPDQCVVTKSAEVQGWALAGIVFVMLSLVAGLIKGMLARRAEAAEAETLPTKSMLAGDANSHI